MPSASLTSFVRTLGTFSIVVRGVRFILSFKAVKSFRHLFADSLHVDGGMNVGHLPSNEIGLPGSFRLIQATRRKTDS